MTSIRAKRNSKAPTRFSSDNDGTETTSTTGVTILDYTNNTTKTTHTLSPVSKAIRLKTTAREPLKVKLPKLRRTQHLQQKTKESTPASINYSEIKIHKIKLPSLLSKKAKQQKLSTVPDSDKESSSETKSSARVEQKYSSGSLLLNLKKPSINKTQQDSERTSDSFLSTGDDLDTSITSKTPQDEKSTANTSFNSSSEGEENVSGMKIVVSEPDASSGSEIRCPCGVNDDLGVMVECERCSTWQHGHCINVGQEDDAEAYEGYICAYCHFPKDKFRESLLQLTVGDKYQVRFDQLEYLIELKEGETVNPDDLIDRFTLEDLSQATKELNRVLNSLRAKWRLLTSQAYEQELRIWQNPHWTDEAEYSSDKDKTFYFMDKCKRNLRFNICNIIKLMEKRCYLLEYALNMATKRSTNTDSSAEMIVGNLKRTLETISNSVKEYKSHYMQIQSS